MNRRRAKRAYRPNPREDRNFSEFRSNKNRETEVRSRRKKINLFPKNIVQEQYIAILEDNTTSIIVSTGPAGTGKTYLATKVGMKQLNEGNVNKIIITRPTREVSGNKLGFLPGGINEKMDPWVRPIVDVFKEEYTPREINHLIEEGILEFSPLAFMRGRTFKDAFVIADEMQNTTLDEMKMILTRIGENCRMVVDGDIKQSDIGSNNGLSYFSNLLEGKESSNIKHIQFNKSHIIRNKVVEEVLTLFGE